MARHHTHRLGLLALTLLALLPATARAVYQYEVIDIGTLGGWYSWAWGINNRGQVVGEAAVDGDDMHAFLYSDGVMNDLGTLGGARSYAYGINDSGQVAGTAYTGTGTYRAYLYSGGVMDDLGTLGGTSSDAYGVNNRGEVVGWADSEAGTRQAFVFTNGAMQALPGIDSEESSAWGINDNGQIVGQALIDGNQCAFLYSDGTVTYLDTPPGVDSRAGAINNAGEITGHMGSSPRAFLYSDGTITELQGYTGGADINNHSQIVGWSPAFLYSDGEVYSLRSLVEPDSGWVLFTATAINDAAWIVGWGLNREGQQHGLLLKPIILLGDVNLDSVANALDIQSFVRAVVTPGTYQGEADVNQDGIINALDIQGFVQRITQVGIAVPEPAGFAVVMPGAMALARRRR